MVVVPTTGCVLPAQPSLPHASNGAMVCPCHSFWRNVAPGDRHGSPPEKMLSPIQTIELAAVQVFLKKIGKKWMSFFGKKWMSFFLSLVCLFLVDLSIVNSVLQRVEEIRECPDRSAKRRGNSWVSKYLHIQISPQSDEEIVGCPNICNALRKLESVRIDPQSDEEMFGCPIIPIICQISLSRIRLAAKADAGHPTSRPLVMTNPQNLTRTPEHGRTGRFVTGAPAGHTRAS